MQILILVDVQHLQNVVISFDERFKWLKSLLLRLPPPDKPPSKNSDSFPTRGTPPHTFTLFEKPWGRLP